MSFTLIDDERILEHSNAALDHLRRGFPLARSLRLRISWLPEWWRHRTAHALGYFWLSCPLCMRPFAGYEWRSGWAASIPTSEQGISVGICSACTKVNKEWLTQKSLNVAYDWLKNLTWTAEDPS